MKGGKDMKLITSELKDRDALVKARKETVRDGYTLIADKGYAMVFSCDTTREIVVLTRKDV